MSRTSYRELIDFAAGERGSLTTTLKAHLKTHRAAATTVALYRLARATLLADDGVAPSAAAVASARALFPPQRARSAAEGIADHVAMILGRLIFHSRAEPALAGLRGRLGSLAPTQTLAMPVRPPTLLRLQPRRTRMRRRRPGDRPLRKSLPDPCIRPTSNCTRPRVPGSPRAHRLHPAQTPCPRPRLWTGGPHSGPILRHLRPDGLLRHAR